MRALALAAVACTSAAKPAPPTNVVFGEPISHAPFVINNAIVAEDGHVIRRVPGGDYGDIAEPIAPHRFQIAGKIVDTEADAITHMSPMTAWIGDTLTRYEPDGRVRWQAEVKGVHSVRPPDVAIADGHAIAAVIGELHAFDDATGAAQWVSRDSEAFTLAMLGHTLLSISCNEPTHQHALVATEPATGRTLWQAALPNGCDPSLAVSGRYAYVVEGRGNPTTFVFDERGHQVASLDEGVLAGSPLMLDDDVVMIATKHILRLDARGNVVWQRPTLESTFVGAAQLGTLPGGDIVIANWGSIDDSGVDLMRLRASDGDTVWHVHADGLGVAHSEYLHRAYIEVRGDVIYVASEGSGGGFLERRSVATGARQLRCLVGVRCTR